MSRQNSRAIASEILSKVLADKGSLATYLTRETVGEDFPFVQEICFGVCRFYFPLNAIVKRLVEKPLRRKDLDVQCLLMVGIYQLFYMRVPNHAAVNETVDAARALKKPWAKGLVNAVLRKCIATQGAIEELLDPDDEESRYSHPAWLISLVKQDWPDHWQQILTSNNQRAPMTLRVNLGIGSRENYLDKLKSQGIEAVAGKLSDSSIYLAEPCPVLDLPGFELGEVSVQDEASQLVARLLNIAPGYSVLDACAAPGGKIAHILESEQSLTRVVALDNSAERLNHIENNLQRLHLRADIKLADAMQPDAWWDKIPFDRILLDAPCSATGVIRRHPDIKLLRRQSDIKNSAERQLGLLLALWDCLKPGGFLLYTTCSILKLENDDTISRFLDLRQDAKYQAIAADWGVECRYGRQLFPESQGNDGFYYSLLGKGE